MKRKESLRLTMAQALVRYLMRQFVNRPEGEVAFIAGVWAIFGHGNVAGLGEALFAVKDGLNTYRAHNEQAMAHAAIAFAKAMRRQRAMACTTSIGPGATNMVTAAALAHVNRLPLLLLPGDVFANRRPDPVLQQLEAFHDGTVSVNDCFRPVSRYFDRISRPEQIMTALPRAMAVMTSPSDCGPVTLGLCQDVQAEMFDFPAAFFEPRLWDTRAPSVERADLEQLSSLLRQAERPIFIVGGGVHYSDALNELDAFAASSGIPCVETQAGKGALPFTHPQNLGAVGVTGTQAANAAIREADLIVGLGTRLQDFTTGSSSLLRSAETKLIQVNTASHDAHKHNAIPIIADIAKCLSQLHQNMGEYTVDNKWREFCRQQNTEWAEIADQVTRSHPGNGQLPSDVQVVGTVNAAAMENSIVVCAAGGLPGELHKFWRTQKPGGYHLEYGYSCMGYEIAGGLGVKLAEGDRDVIVMVGDGSYLMMNSEITTAIALKLNITIILLDNRGFGCISRLQKSVGVDQFRNLLSGEHESEHPQVDFVAHSASLGASSRLVSDLDELKLAVTEAQQTDSVSVIVIRTDPNNSSEDGGAWWDVPVAECSETPSVRTARRIYDENRKTLRDDST